MSAETEAGTPKITRASVGLRSERGPVLLALMISTALIALEATILATAVPGIVRDLGGFNQFPWLFSIYLLAQAVTVPIYGRLADVYGRKRIMLVGIGLFLIGSVLCGLAWNMLTLILFRAIQGFGAGAVAPMSITIAGDMYSLAERAKAQGYLASMWAVASVVGPVVGGVFSDLDAWRWIFAINIPLCLLAAWLIVRNFHEKLEARQQKIDFAGAVLIAGGSALLILGLLEGGQTWPWLSAPSFAVFGAALALIVAFVLVEQRVAQPIVPLWIFQRRVTLSTSFVALGVGAILLGLSSYVPTFGQEVLGASALLAGFAIAALTLGWPIAATNAGRVYLRIGFRATALIGSAFVITGSALNLLLGADSTIWFVAINCAVIGFGMGWVASPALIAAQSSVGWGERGVVTAGNVFARSIGSAIGVAVFGAIVNAAVGGADDPSPEALTGGIHSVFIALLVVSIGIAIAVSFMPGRTAAMTVEPAPVADPS
ncbi:MFS transporter [Naasia lichenicola]|uniref:MFS transporter n=1 Tax=Naasia lichenicola TaxID=2565933 RepID=UPI003F6A2525